MHKKFTSHYRQCPLGDDHFATWFLLTTDLLGGSEEELQQLSERLEKTAADIKPRPSTNIWMNGKTSQRWNVNKGTKEQTGASTLRHDKASNTVKKAISFPTKITLYKSLVLSITALWMWKLDIDCVSGKGNPRFFLNKCYRRMLAISYRERKANEYVWQ